MPGDVDEVDTAGDPAIKEPFLTWCELFLFLHISATIIWIGGGFFNQTLALRILATRDTSRIAGVRK